MTAERLLEAPHVDDRGSLQVLWRHGGGSVVRIVSRQGTRRANHWHREDSHLCFVESGSIYYLERAVGSNEPPREEVFHAGQAFYTGPNVEHAMVFLQDTVFLTFSPRERTQVDYEADLVRLQAPLAVR